MTLMIVRLELAREPAFPSGSHAHGYELVAPLDGDGLLDVEEWRANKARCKVRRFWPDEDDRIGTLTHNRSHWRFHYGDTPEDDDEDIFKLGNHKLLVGEYVSIREDDDELHTFQVVRCDPLPKGG